MWYDNLIKMKKDSGFTTDEIAKKSGVPKGTLNKLFTNQTRNPKLSTIRKVVHSLGYTLDDLGYEGWEEVSQKKVIIEGKEIPPALRDIGVTWMKVDEICKEMGLTPKDVEELLKTLSKIK